MKLLSLNALVSFIFVFAFIRQAQAQVQKGDDIIGFSSSISTQSASTSSISATVLLSYERYLTRKIAIGVGPYMTIITDRGSLVGIFGGNLFMNYGFITGDGKLYPYLGIIGSVSQSISTADTQFQSTTPGTPDKNIASSGNSTVSFFGAGAKAGAKYFMTERINLDVNVNYATNISSVVNGDKVDIGKGGVIQVFLGIGVIIGRKSVAE